MISSQEALYEEGVNQNKNMIPTDYSDLTIPAPTHV